MSEHKRYNVLLILTDQLRYPRFPYGSDHGLLDPIKNIVGFADGVTPESPYADMFPGFMALRQQALVMRNHHVAATACVPSRATIMTGQYGTRTGVTQTNGLFKSGDAHNFPWLDSDGIPTVGDWFRAAGYSTHYFGKWHVSNPADHSLDRWGFSDWDLSYPEPHGKALNNLGSYRDYGFADLAATFLRRRGLGWGWDRRSASAEQARPLMNETPTGQKPFFGVVSFTNPHDIAAYPTLTRSLNPSGQKPDAPVEVPVQGAHSPAPEGGSMSLSLNPRGFTGEGANVPPLSSLTDELLNKPSCQFDYAYKCGLGLACGGGSLEFARLAPMPFQLNAKPNEWAEAFVRYYAYLMHVVDQHIATVMRALEEAGLRDSTIVVFSSDHGEYGTAHNYMIEKWHGAYDEILKVPLVVNAPWVSEPGDNQLRSLDTLTSHIDVAPTLLGLAGVDESHWPELASRMETHQTPAPFAGSNLAPLMSAAGEGKAPASWPLPKDADGKDRDSVLFITDDRITEPLTYASDRHNAAGNQAFGVFCQRVDEVRQQVPRLKPGAVTQPNHLRCLCTRDWKLVRYFDPLGQHADEWELYHRRVDPLETHNLLVFNGAFPTVVPERDFPEGLSLTGEQIAAEAERLFAKLQTSEQQMLTPLAPVAVEQLQAVP